MRRTVITLSVTAVLLFGGCIVTLAQDTAPPPPAPIGEKEPAAAADTAKSDPEALAILAAAAKRQGGSSLAAPGALQSFRIEFGNIKVWRYTRKEDGGWDRANEVASAMAIDWMRNEGKESSLRTFWEVNGKKVWRAVNAQREFFWLSDGHESEMLTPGTHDADREEVLLHRRLSETLLDVAVLHKLRSDGSVWKRIEDDTYAGVALRRTPAPGSAGLRLTIWFDAETRDPQHVRVEPVAGDAPTMHYALRYEDGLPEEIFSVKGATLRFPREIAVHEEYEGIPRRQVMNMFVDHVTFNEVKPSAFGPSSTFFNK